MSLEEGVGEEVLSIGMMEVEIETTPFVPEKEGRSNHNRQSNSALTPPLPGNQTPFHSAKGFGNWLYEQLDENTFMKVHLRFIRYCQNFKIRRLVHLGKSYFRDIQRLHFLKGVFIVATSMKQKKYVNQVLEKELRKMVQAQRRN
ncbi:hypothetical protein Ocin01_16317 [Orchesella cincta]|uniref:Uncharacterized protein n=1 Tax=Orchesella cincta TaxID=48709 RepID=A0A1D2MBR1_ORCCI|nr:hypothetical protein Ocin01_16317 [Orchesella cincta]